MISLLWLKGAAEAFGINKKKVARKTENEASKKRRVFLLLSGLPGAVVGNNLRRERLCDSEHVQHTDHQADDTDEREDTPKCDF